MSNRLSTERSPYLLQHMDNPVAWWPWGPEVFQEASRTGKPIFLSIGYSTCHWCHVMAHESFEDEAVAQAINTAFLPVKVDREERPDVDAVYMEACLAMNGSGGWPLTVLLTPEQKPFWAGTYLPKAQLLHLVHEAARLWREDRAGLLAAGEALTAQLRRETENRPGMPGRELVQQAVSQFAQSFDGRWGGFGPAPKFPTPHNLVFLLRYGCLSGNERAREMALHTLDAMYRGGLFDHVGGGFSRYSTDERWLVPHFEKMLYDNALLVLAYAEAFQHTRRPLYEQVVRRTLDYVLRELSAPQGGFCCGQDADSDGVEGAYYTLTLNELTRVLGKSDADRFCEWYGITPSGNFEGKSIPNLLDQTEFDREPEGMAALRARVYTYRLGRTVLNRDDKVLTAWNGLAGAARDYPAGHSFAMLAFLEELWPTAELVAAAQETPKELQTFLQKTFYPGLTVLVKTSATADALAVLAPFTKDYPIPKRGTRYYLCRGGACTRPVDSISELEALLTQNR